MNCLIENIGGLDCAVFTLFGQSFLYSANTLTYFPITNCAKDLLLCKSYFENESADNVILRKYSYREIELTISKLKEFKQNQVLALPSFRTPENLLFGDYYLKLVPTRRCNLHCNYCFADKTGKDTDMSLDVAKKAINYFVFSFVPKNAKRYIIDLTGAGEPLLRLDFILEVNRYVQEIKRQQKINIFCQLATNGMLLTPDVSRELKDNMILFGVSLDGDKKSSISARRGLDYDVVKRNVQLVDDKQFFGLAATYSNSNHNFIHIFKTLNAFCPGAIGMKPVRLPESCKESINSDNIESIKHSYNKFMFWMYKQLSIGNAALFHTFMSGEDYFAKFLKTVIRPFRLFYRCSAGLNSFAVDMTGNILICPAFIMNPDGVIGSIDSGIDSVKLNFLRECYADKISYCKRCWARYVCAGECFSVGYMNHREFVKPATSMCHLKKHLIQLSVYFWTILRYEHPDIYSHCLEIY